MAEVLDPIVQSPLVVHTSPAWQMDDEEFFEFCQINPDLRIEKSADGDILIMAPAGGSSSSGNAELTYLFKAWAERDQSGRIFDSSGGFNLPNGATRSPVLAWVRNDKLERLTDEEWDKFLPLSPDFALELCSPSDSLALQQEKMDEYISNGALLGWLLDPIRKKIHVYRPGIAPEIFDDPQELSGDPVLRGFVLPVPRVWAAMRRKR